MMVGGDLMMFSGSGLAIAGLYSAPVSFPAVAVLVLGGAGVFWMGFVKGRRGFIQSEEALAALGASSENRRWV